MCPGSACRKDAALADTPFPDFARRLGQIGGETGRMMAARDWAGSPLGPPAAWPQSLRSVVGLMLGSKFPMFVAWGPELALIYNDAYAAILGAKHPQALGARFDVVWHEIWPDIVPLIEAALAGEATYHEDLPLLMNRRGHDEQTWFTFSYSPVHDESGAVAGMFCAVSETTGKVLAEQRQRFVVALGDTLAGLTDPAAVTAAAAELLGRHLQVRLAGYSAVDASGEVVSSAGRWKLTGAAPGTATATLEDFGPALVAELQAGRTVVVSDCLTDPRTAAPASRAAWDAIDTRALIAAPLVSAGRLVAILSVHSAAPRGWSPLEVQLVEDVGSRTWAAVERSTALAALRESEVRQAFLLALSDALRPLRRAADMAAVAAERLGERFGLSRVFYAEFFGSVMKVEHDFTCGVESIAGEHDLADFGPDLLRAYRETAVVRVDDVQTDPRFCAAARAGLAARQVGAYVDVVLFRDDAWVSLLALQSATPRIWAPAEEALFREVGERVRLAVERVHAEDQLRELNETLEHRVAAALAERNLLASLVETTDVMIMALDFDHTILALNAANAAEFERVYGVRPKRGDNLLGLLADRPEQRDHIRSVWARGMRGETVTLIDNPVLPGRDRLHYEIILHPLRDETGAQVGVYQFVTDVSDRYRREAQLADAQEALRQSQKMEAMGQLTGGVAHDFNNLLTPIVGALDMLQRKQLGGEREQRIIAGAMQSAGRATTLVQRLLAFARRQPLQPVAVDLARLVSGMAALIASTTGPQIRVRIEVPDGLPPASADPHQLEMALLNLAVNARDAMAEAGGTLTIAAGLRDIGPASADPGPTRGSRLAAGTYLCLSVTDTGTGMDEATIARAVEPFFSTKGVGKGTGLGLSMVHGLASQLGGALDIRSRRGAGTTIELWLPSSAAMPAAEGGGAEPPVTAGPRGIVLLVDDEPLVRASTAEMLGDLGYTVREASSGEEALRLIRARVRVDLVVTDHLMPGINGTELARAVRVARPGLPVLLVSGYAEREGLDPDLPRLTKPFRKDELAASLARLAAAGRA